jgi:hypothetical protein
MLINLIPCGDPHVRGYSHDPPPATFHNHYPNSSSGSASSLGSIEEDIDKPDPNAVPHPVEA